MNLNMKVHNIKSIEDFSINLPLEKGLYAITGENASGKSTIVACAATVFFNMPMNDYFGKPQEDSYIEFTLDGAIRKWGYRSRNWSRSSSGYMNIKGFFEGSIIYGNRFRDTTFASIKKLDNIDDADLEQADEFVRTNLGHILRNDKEYYSKLFQINKDKAHNKYSFNGEPYIYEKKGIRVSQPHMSTGENLLVTILHSLNMRISQRGDMNVPCLMFLDEIELALHSSALRRLVAFLKGISNQFNLSIYFSTHSIDLIRDISPSNIFYIEKYIDESLQVINPCYPAYATKNLYDASFGYDVVILVEDDLAKDIVNRLLNQYRLLNNKLVCILPCGGWQNVIKMANDVLDSNLLSGLSKVMVILDGDIQIEVQPFMDSNNIKLNTPLNYLPIESLEKYLKYNLFDTVNQKLYTCLNNYIFHKVGLNVIIRNYCNSGPYDKNDKNGKELFSRLETELQNNNKSRADLVEMIVQFLIENDPQRIGKIESFLRKQI